MNNVLEKSFDLKDGDSIDLVHIFEKHTYFSNLSTFNFPSESQEEEIRNSIVDILDSYKEKLKAKKNLAININSHCLFSSSPKEEAVNFLEKNKTDVAVVATREKNGLKGFFTSSFADYLCRHGKSDVYVTKH